MILHLCAAAEWERVRDQRHYAPESLASEGFVHCTGDDETLVAVANRFYLGATEPMVVLELDENRLDAEVVWEAPAHPDGSPAAPDEPRFPHVYGPLLLTAVTSVRPLRRLEAGGAYVGIG